MIAGYNNGTPLTGKTDITPYVITEFGAAPALIFSIAAAAFILKESRFTRPVSLAGLREERDE